jgi:hypothetical protein
MALVAGFLFAGPETGAAAAKPSLSLGGSNGITLAPGGDSARTFRLKGQGVAKLTVRLVVVSGEQAKTCATCTYGWKLEPKDKPGELGEILLLYKHQRDEQIIPSLGFDAPRAGAGTSNSGGVVKVKGKSLFSVRPAADLALSPKQEHLLEIAVVADKDGEKQFRASEKDLDFTTDSRTLKKLEEVKTWAKKNPKVSVIVLTVSWLPAGIKR